MTHKVKRHNGCAGRNTLPGGQRYQSVVGTKWASAVAERGPHPHWEVHVDAGELIAVAAVVAAFAGAVGAFLGILVGESKRAENARKELLMTARIAVYGQFLAATSRILSSALDRASNSASTRDEAAAHELNRIIAEIQVIGGVGVRAALKNFLEHVSDVEQSAADHDRESRIAQDILARDNFYNVLRSVTRSNLEATIKADCSALEDAMHTELGV